MQRMRTITGRIFVYIVCPLSTVVSGWLPYISQAEAIGLCSPWRDEVEETVECPVTSAYSDLRLDCVATHKEISSGWVKKEYQGFWELKYKCVVMGACGQPALGKCNYSSGGRRCPTENVKGGHDAEWYVVASGKTSRTFDDWAYARQAASKACEEEKSRPGRANRKKIDDLMIACSESAKPAVKDLCSKASVCCPIEEPTAEPVATATATPGLRATATPGPRATPIIRGKPIANVAR